LVAVSFTPGTFAPLASVMVPLKEPVAVCEKASPQLRTSAANNVVIFLILISPLIFGSEVYDFP
jgi:hypothetical protein